MDLQKLVDQAKANSTVTIPPGMYSQGLKIRKPLTLRGTGVILDGLKAANQDGLWIYKATDVKILPGLEVRNFRRYGVFATEAHRLEITESLFNCNGVTGILTGNTHHVLLQNNTCNDNVKEHGIYCSQSGDNGQIIGNICHNNGGSAIQVNATQGSPHPKDPTFDGLSTAWIIKGNDVTGSKAGAGINLAGLLDSIVMQNNIHDMLSCGGIALFDDGWGAKYACCRNRVVGNILHNLRYGVLVGKGCQKNILQPNDILNCATAYDIAPGAS